MQFLGGLGEGDAVGSVRYQILENASTSSFFSSLMRFFFRSGFECHQDLLTRLEKKKWGFDTSFIP